MTFLGPETKRLSINFLPKACFRNMRSKYMMINVAYMFLQSLIMLNFFKIFSGVVLAHLLLLNIFLPLLQIPLKLSRRPFVQPEKPISLKVVSRDAIRNGV